MLGGSALLSRRRRPARRFRVFACFDSPVMVFPNPLWRPLGVWLFPAQSAVSRVFRFVSDPVFAWIRHCTNLYRIHRLVLSLYGIDILK